MSKLSAANKVWHKSRVFGLNRDPEKKDFDKNMAIKFLILICILVAFGSKIKPDDPG